MYSVGHTFLKQFVSDKLAAAAEEIFAIFHNTIVEYEKELCRHRKLMELAWKPEVKLRRIDLPRQCVFTEEAVDQQSSSDQNRIFKVDQEELELPVIKEQQEELSIFEFRLEEEPEDLQLYSVDEETNRIGDTAVDWNPEVSEAKNELQPLSFAPQKKVREEGEHESDRNQVACVSNECDSSSSGLSPKSMGIQTANKPCGSQGGRKSISELKLKQEPEDLELCSTNETSIKSEDPTLDWNPEKPLQDCEVVPAANSDLSLYPGVSHSQELTRFKCKNSRSRRHKLKNTKLSSRGTVFQHKTIHTANEPHNCQECGKSFLKSLHLNRHMKTHTNRERPHACPTCGKRFLTRAHLKQHEAIHTGERTHVCQVCSKRFLLRKSLSDHIRIHKAERPHVCQICNKRFLRGRDVTRHMRIHTVEKPHVCETCGKSFTQSGHLTQHMVVHQGQKRFSCKECGKCFPGSFSLTHHVASAHCDF